MHAKRKVLVFGGSFSPPTLAHEAIIEACLLLPQFDEVWVMPSGDRLDKTIAATDKDRLNMLEIVIGAKSAAEPRLKLSDFELRLPRPTQTSQTFPMLARAFPDTEFWLAVGRDSYLSMPEWPDGKSLQRTLRLVVFYSGDAAGLDASNVTAVQLPQAVSDVSSTVARRSIAAGSHADVGVSQPVLDYIKQHNLYQN
jgi:nicotinate-nucleotide adenylyltransferase